jgi:signal transduction histidine kinase
MGMTTEGRCDGLVAELNASFATTPAIGMNAAIERALARIGDAFDLDSAGIVDSGKGNGSRVFTHRWSAPGAASGGMAEHVEPLVSADCGRAGLWLAGRYQRPWPDLSGIAASLSMALRLRQPSGALSAHVARVATLGGLAASLAHELNQPLTAIRSNAQTAQRYLSALPQRTGELHSILLDIVSDVTRAGEIIDRMRSLLKNGPPSVTTVDLNEVVRGVTKLVASDALIRRVQVTPILQPALPPLRGDRVQIQQVVLNLLLNALEAIDRGRCVDRRVMVTTQGTENAQTLLTIRDTGPGLGPTPERWFEPFQSTKEGGLGVGLSITRMIVEAHGGSVRADNTESGGAAFQVRLPTNEGILP